ncbi:MAG: hypothetical protein ABSF43_02235 [Rectinemataceae bacterium]
MKRTVLVGIAIAVFTIGAFSETPPPVAQSILAPGPSSQSSAVKTKIPLKRKALPTSSGIVLYAKGVISRIHALDGVKKLPERIVLSVGKNAIEIAVDTATVVKNAKGKLVALATLKKGERIKVAYKALGKLERAKSITILS